jgi:TetR/AcrR family tetracycline transcriptional repressor
MISGGRHTPARTTTEEALHQARIIVLTVLRFTVGYVLEEQAGRPDAAALKDFDMDAFAASHLDTMTAITEYFEPGRTIDDLFRECLQTILEGLPK